MSALIVRLGPVRNAVDQSARFGLPETRQQVVNRIVADIRAGHHPYVPTLADAAIAEHRQLLNAGVVRGGAA